MSQNDSIIFSYALDGQGGCLPAEQQGSQPLWTHVDMTSRDARRLLIDDGLEEYVVDTLVREESRPHTTAVGDGLVVILRGINRNAGADPEDMVSVRIWLERERILSVRQRKLMAAQETAEILLDAQQRGPTSTTELLIAIINRLADGIAQFVDDLEARMEEYEDQIEQGDSTVIRSDVSAVRRQVAQVRRYLAPQRDALESLFRLGNKLLDSEQLFAVREQSDRIMRYIEDLDLVRERTLVAQEELMNRISQEQNARTYVFSVVAAIFLPITFISGVFGMNTAGLPGLEHPAAFWIVAGVMTAISVGVIIWLRLKRWF